MSSEREAILACQAGKTEMYELLVDKYKMRAFYAALLYTKNRDDALDLSQEAFYRAYKALKGFDVSRNFYTWFYKILKNLCINHLQRKKYINQINQSLDYEKSSHSFQPQVENPEEIFERNERSEMLWRAINSLKDTDKEIIILKEFNEMSYQEIADILEIPIGSVMSRLYYARKKLLKQLESLNG